MLKAGVVFIACNPQGMGIKETGTCTVGVVVKGAVKEVGAVRLFPLSIPHFPGGGGTLLYLVQKGRRFFL